MATTFTSDKSGFLYSPDHLAIGEVEPDEVFHVETLDCFSGRYTPPNAFSAETAEWVEANLNPVTGPIAVRGAKPGDVVEVTIHEIELVGPGLVVVSDCTAPSPDDWWLQETHVRPVATDGTTITIREGLRVPAKPLVGCLAVAPAKETALSKREADHYGGNMDAADLTAGATLTLPINVDGAQLYFGDCKAAVGMGEIVCAPEIATRLTVSARVAPMPPGFRVPRLRRGTTLTTIASDISLADAARRAFADLKVWVENELDLTSDDAAVLLGMVGHCGIAQVSNTLHTATATLDLADVIRDEKVGPQ